MGEGKVEQVWRGRNEITERGGRGWRDEWISRMEFEISGGKRRIR